MSIPPASEGSILVIEDAPAGIQAGVAAGCKVIGLLTSHSAERVMEAGAHWIVKDLESVKFKEHLETGRLLVSITEALEV